MAGYKENNCKIFTYKVSAVLVLREFLVREEGGRRAGREKGEGGREGEGEGVVSICRGGSGNDD